MQQIYILLFSHCLEFSLNLITHFELLFLILQFPSLTFSIFFPIFHSLLLKKKILILLLIAFGLISIVVKKKKESKKYFHEFLYDFNDCNVSLNQIKKRVNIFKKYFKKKNRRGFQGGEFSIEFRLKNIRHHGKHEKTFHACGRLTGRSIRIPTLWNTIFFQRRIPTIIQTKQ